MAVQVITEAEVMREVSQILLQHLAPTKAARFWASWHGGQGNYLDWRDKEFAGETLDQLYTEILALQQEPERPTDGE